MLRDLVMGIVTAALVLAAVEGLLRLTVAPEALLFSWERTDGPLVFTEGGGVTVRPDTTATYLDGPFEWTFTTEVHGFREDEAVTPERPAGTLRILALGDSWVFGTSANQGKTLPDQLERLLGERLGRPVEVINAGIPSGAAFDMLRVWRAVGWSWELDGVLLGRPHNEWRQGEREESRARWYEAVRGAPFVNSFVYLGLRRLIAPMMRPAYAQTEGLATETAVADLRTVAEDARSRGLPVWLALWPNQWTDVSRGERPVQAIYYETLAPLGVRYAGHGLPDRACWGFQDLGHPSQAGYAAIARVVADLIAGGPATAEPLETPRCASVGEIGPGLPGAPTGDAVPKGPPLGPDGQPIRGEPPGPTAAASAAPG